MYTFKELFILFMFLGFTPARLLVSKIKQSANAEKGKPVRKEKNDLEMGIDLTFRIGIAVGLTVGILIGFLLGVFIGLVLS